jgi:hypothetical protein
MEKLQHLGRQRPKIIRSKKQRLSEWPPLLNMRIYTKRFFEVDLKIEAGA